MSTTMTGKCPMCGFAPVVQGKEVHTIMNNYIREDGKESMCINNKVEKFTNAQDTWIREDVFHKSTVAETIKEITPPSIEPKPNPFAPKTPTTPLSGPI